MGIGTTSPVNSLHVKGTGDLSTIRIEETGTDNATLWMENPGQSYVLLIDNNNGDKFQIGDGVSQFFTLTPNGNAGIGTEPLGKFDVGGLTYLRGAPTHSILSEQLRFGRLDSDIRYHSIYSYHSENASTNLLQFRIHTGNSSDLTEQISTMTLTGSGNVGIGTSAPSKKLTVTGTVKAEEVVVVENIGADFVFDDDYTLPSLSEVEQHILSYNHLPQIPSAEQMIDNGVKVGKLQMKLLQKIEELTLYMIRLKKENEELKEKVEKLQAEVI